MSMVRTVPARLASLTFAAPGPDCLPGCALPGFPTPLNAAASNPALSIRRRETANSIVGAFMEWSPAVGSSCESAASEATAKLTPTEQPAHAPHSRFFYGE